jgi:hypothetical protein
MHKKPNSYRLLRSLTLSLKLPSYPNPKLPMPSSPHARAWALTPAPQLITTPQHPSPVVRQRFQVQTRLTRLIIEDSKCWDFQRPRNWKNHSIIRKKIVNNPFTPIGASLVPILFNFFVLKTYFLLAILCNLSSVASLYHKWLDI